MMLSFIFLVLLIFIISILVELVYCFIKSIIKDRTLKLPEPNYKKIDNARISNYEYKILAIINEQGILDSLSIYLNKSGYYFIGITNPNEALKILEEESFDLLIFDYTAALATKNNIIEKIRKINNELFILLLTNSKKLAPSFETIKKLNIQGYCEKWDNFNQLILLIESGINNVKQIKEIKLINTTLANTNQQLEQSYMEIIQTLRHTVEAKDTYTLGHSDRVAKISVLIGKKLDLPKDDLKKLEIGGLFHDIGKIGIPDSILLKNSKLSDNEYMEIKKHPSIGAKILSNSSFFQDILPIVKYHHERFDGNGYPEQLSGIKIPYLARITSIADAYDAMTSKRSYRDSLPISTAISEIEKCSGSQFDPKIAKVFIDILKNEPEKIKEIQKHHSVL